MIYSLCSKRHTNRIPGSIRPRLERARDDKGPWFDSTLPREEWDRLQCLPPECENECHLCGQPGVRDETALADHFYRCHPREDPRRLRLSDVDSGDDDDSDNDDSKNKSESERDITSDPRRANLPQVLLSCLHKLPRVPRAS